VGGDEFAVLIEANGATFQAVSLAQHLAEEICLPVMFERHVLQVGASIGIASNLEGPLKPHELLRRADIAMYHCKSNGKGEIAMYDKAFDEGRLHRMAIERQISRGLANGEFEVFYQPVISAGSGAVIAAEALVRWPGRVEGPLDPDQFIDIAEATGQIHPLGLLVLRRACEDFLGLGELRLSVNVSPAQFRDPGFERQVAEILQQTGFPPQRLQLEITESYLLAHPERVVAVIREFKAMGISVALDDFGTGFTSIHYLRSYGFSHIKIDKSLVSGLAPGNKASLLVAGAILLAKGLDMGVIAEGVEEVQQADLLRDAGCDHLQGYLFGSPLPYARFCHANHLPQPQPAAGTQPATPIRRTAA
jgi:EAL domain-containing protein (putative c-di-GMP-specific phosphodiesterase class I)